MVLQCKDKDISLLHYSLLHVLIEIEVEEDNKVCEWENLSIIVRTVKYLPTFHLYKI